MIQLSTLSQHDVYNLIASGKPFVTDVPEFNWLTLQTIAALKTHEAHVASEASRLSNEKKRENGVPIGSQHPKVRAALKKREAWNDANAASSQVRMQLRDDHLKQFAHIIEELREKKTPWEDIATHLNNLGYRTRRGAKYTTSSLYNSYQVYIKAT